jgi:hypothetical protein
MPQAADIEASPLAAGHRFVNAQAEGSRLDPPRWTEYPTAFDKLHLPEMPSASE